MPEREADEAADTTIPLLDGVSQEQWNYWHQHPGTRLLLKYLRDYAESLKIAVMQRWQEGTLELTTEHEIRNRILQCGEIEKLSFEDLREFYDVPKEQT